MRPKAQHVGFTCRSKIIVIQPGLLDLVTDFLLHRSVTDHIILEKELFHITYKCYSGFHHTIHTFKLTVTSFNHSKFY